MWQEDGMDVALEPALSAAAVPIATPCSNATTGAGDVSKAILGSQAGSC